MASPDPINGPHATRIVALLKFAKDTAVLPHLADRPLQPQLAAGVFHTCPNKLAHRERCNAVIGWMPPSENVLATDLQWSCNSCSIAAFGGPGGPHGTAFTDAQTHFPEGELHDDATRSALCKLASSGKGVSIDTVIFEWAQTCGDDPHKEWVAEVAAELTDGASGRKVSGLLALRVHAFLHHLSLIAEIATSAQRQKMLARARRAAEGTSDKPALLENGMAFFGQGDWAAIFGRTFLSSITSDSRDSLVTALANFERALGAQTEHWRTSLATFLDAVPLVFQMPIARAFAHPSARATLAADGNVILHATTRDFIATLIADSVIVPMPLHDRTLVTAARTAAQAYVTPGDQVGSPARTGSSASAVSAAQTPNEAGARIRALLGVTPPASVTSDGAVADSRVSDRNHGTD